jgi:ABC-type Zn2+ transport system substrate-binding protein/surface adhesin
MDNKMRFRNLLIVAFWAGLIVMFKPDSMLAQDATGQNASEEKTVTTETSRYLEAWQSLPLEKREAIRQKYRRFKQLSPEERQKIKENLSRYKELSPEKKEKIKENLQSLKDLSPEERHRLASKYKKWQGLPPEEKKALIAKHEKFRQMPPEKQKQLLENRERWRRLSNEDKSRLKDRYNKEKRPRPHLDRDSVFTKEGEGRSMPARPSGGQGRRSR